MTSPNQGDSFFPSRSCILATDFTAIARISSPTLRVGLGTLDPCTAPHEGIPRSIARDQSPEGPFTVLSRREADSLPSVLCRAHRIPACAGF